MDTTIIASTRKNAGKTSLIVGIAKYLDKDFKYLKPYGDKLYYRKKLLWDYDAALMTNIFDMGENPERMSIGFEHSKIRYRYTEETLIAKLKEMVADVERDCKCLFIEAAETLSYGAYAHLDALSLARHTKGKLVVVVSGDDQAIMDDILFLKRYINLEDVDFEGIIINKVLDMADFKDKNIEEIEKLGVKVIGLVPHQEELMHLTVNNLIDRLFPKIVAGSNGSERVIKTIFIGAMSGSSALQNLNFIQGAKKLVITSGDRSDMILAALESDTSCIVLTNDVLPDPTIISKASELSIPLLLVAEDTYAIAKQIEKMEAVLTRGDLGKIDMLKSTVGEYVNIKMF